jgi:long-chain fatty acid transport protein
LKFKSLAIVIFIASISLHYLAGYVNAGNPVSGSKAAGMGTAFVGVANDPSTIFPNPAGLGNLNGFQIYGGVTVLTLETSFSSQNGETEDTERQYYFPPHFYISYQPDSSDFAYGIGVFSPFGIGGREWPDDGLTRYISTKSFVGTIAINPSVAWKLSPKLFIGGGIYYLYAKSEAESKVDQSQLGSPDADFKVDLEGGNWGYDLGILYKPLDWMSLGLTYRSGVDIDLDGDAKLSKISPALQPIVGSDTIKIDAESELNLPHILSFGLALYPDKNLTIAFDVEWTGWSTYKKTIIDFESESSEMLLPDIQIENDWEDIWLFKVGIDYRITEILSLRTGYSFVESPVPDNTLSPASPEGNQHNITLGLGCSFTNLWLDAFYMLSLYEDRTVQNSILSGTYENEAHYLGFSIGYKF